MGTPRPDLHIRPYTADDQGSVIDVWYDSGSREYTYLPMFQALTRATAGDVFRAHIEPKNKIWVACEANRVIAFLAMQDSYIDRLYVHPSAQGRGVGTQLLEFARTQSPTKLVLHTHQENTIARKTYEQFGFTAVAFGISPAPESVPDVEYQWTPHDG